MTPRFRRLPMLGLLLIALFGPPPDTPGAQDRTSKPVPAATSLFDPRLAPLQQASVTWEVRSGPRRAVVDVVCLVPDVPTFLEAIALWDEGHYFPVLIEDVDFTLKFLRAFRPARVVRFPGRVEPIAEEGLWDAAVNGVGRSWTAEGKEAPLSGDQAPRGLGLCPPGVVVSAPDAPMLPGAVALAAGRFQPLIRWEPGKQFNDTPNAADAESFALDLQARIRDVVPNFEEQLGDDCDFLTIAGDYPFRYNAEEGKSAQGGRAAFDDLLGRDLSGRSGVLRRRWAYTGRLLGNPVASVYRAMCSLFLQPRSAVLFNGYNESRSPFDEYIMPTAAQTLAVLGPVEHRSGDGDKGGSLASWHDVFDPINRADLVLINSSGGSRQFSLRGRPGYTGDVPITKPAAVIMVHSHSASDPTNPATIAGRWLANGAFLYFGSMNEPFLQSFRPPTLVADLIVERLPFSVACRMTVNELPPFGNPWRLVYLGDPLYRFEGNRDVQERTAWNVLDNWPTYQRSDSPGPDADAFQRFAWAVRTAILDAQAGTRPSVELAEVVRSIPRTELPDEIRPMFDLLLADTLYFRDQHVELRSILARIPSNELQPRARRWLETCLVGDLQHALARDDFSNAAQAWEELVRASAPVALVERSAAQVGRLGRSPSHQSEWRQRLERTLNAVKDAPAAKPIKAELKQLGPGR